MSEKVERIAKDTIRIERLLPGPLERVWEWIVDGEKRKQWLAAGDADLKEGGNVELIFDNSLLTPHVDEPPEKYKEFKGETRYVGEVTAVHPPKLFQFTWPETDGSVSEVRFELEEKNEKVLLTITHWKLKEGEEMRGVMAGWRTHLDIMAAKLSGEVPPPFWATHSRYEAQYDKASDI